MAKMGNDTPQVMNNMLKVKNNAAIVLTDSKKDGLVQKTQKNMF